MKKIFLLIATVCGMTACEPEQEEISNGGHITVEELRSATTVSVDSKDGKNGNVITCETLAPVNAKWNLGYVTESNSGKAFVSNYAKSKMLLGKHNVRLTATCADGTVLVTDYEVECETITEPLVKVYIYGENPEEQPAFKPGAWDAAAMRFSDNEGRCQYGTAVSANEEDGKFEASPLFTNLPYLDDNVYFGCKTLIFELTDVSDDCDMKVMNGWWSATYYDHVPIKKQMSADGKWELALTGQIANDCARGGDGRDLDLMLYSGTMTVHSIYYEE